jgi:hypothetical protein
MNMGLAGKDTGQRRLIEKRLWAEREQVLGQEGGYSSGKAVLTVAPTIFCGFAFLGFIFPRSTKV